MTDELRAAAERVFGGPSGYSQDGFIPRRMHPNLVEDMERVCRAYLAEHPADDDGDKPWDSDWLLSIGGRRDVCWINIECERCTLAFLPEMPHAGEVKIEDEYGSGPWVSCETRRQVRDLLRVLKGGE